MRRHAEQQPATLSELLSPARERFHVVVDVLENLEGADEVEPVDADGLQVVEHPRAGQGRQPLGRDRAGYIVRLDTNVIEALRQPRSEGSLTRADLEDAAWLCETHVVANAIEPQPGTHRELRQRSPV